MSCAKTMAQTFYGERRFHADGKAMRLTIATKIFFAVSFVSFAAIALVVIATSVSLQRGFATYVSELQLSRLDSLCENLQQIYAVEGNWNSLQKDPRRWRAMVRQSEEERRIEPPPLRGGGDRPPPHDFPGRRLGPPPVPHSQPPPPPPPPRRGPGRLPPLDDMLSLLSPEGQPIIGRTPRLTEGYARRHILHDGNIVGFLVISTPILTTEVDREFIRNSSNALYVIGAVGLLSSVLVALFLARHFGRPLQRLASSARQLATGDYSPRLQSDRSDEIGSLMRDFDHLSLALGRLEESRRNFVADSSHELRTPLAVLRAQIEALQDGVYTADAKVLNSMHRQVLQLSKLVDDLHDLARADAGALAFHKVPVDLTMMIEESLAAFSARYATKNICYHMDFVPRKGAVLTADPDRLRQLFSNLIENSLRYTDNDGELRISLRRAEDLYTLTFEDSAPGVSAHALTHLFERFYRADKSRERETGGSGLGLAICKSIVEAHGGSITAASSKLGGIRITVELPANGQ